MSKMWMLPATLKQDIPLIDKPTQRLLAILDLTA